MVAANVPFTTFIINILAITYLCDRYHMFMWFRRAGGIDGEFFGGVMRGISFWTN